MSNSVDFKKLTHIFITFFKIGYFTFGGGYAMIPLIEREMIARKGWIEGKDMIDIFAISGSLPGAIAINSATFIGYKVAGRKGAFAATFGVVLPSFLIITFIAIFFSKLQDNKIVEAAFLGIRSAVVGLIVLAAAKVSKSAIKDQLTVVIAVLTVIFILTIDIHAICIILGGAGLGLLIYLLFPNEAKKIIARDVKGGKVDDLS